METAINIATGMAIVAVGIIWLAALCRWDGKYPCKPEDCDNCLYKGTGCHPNQNHYTER